MVITTYNPFPTDILEYSNRYIIKVNMPGFTIEDVDFIKINMKTDEITIKVDRDKPYLPEEGELPFEDCRYVIKENQNQIHLERSFILKDITKFASKIDAEIRNGILTIVVPKKTAEEIKEDFAEIKYAEE